MAQGPTIAQPQDPQDVRCVACGTSSPRGGLYVCRECCEKFLRRRSGQEAEAPAAGPSACPSCGTQGDPEAEVCRGCGAELEIGEERAKPAARTADSRNRLFVILCAVIGTLVLYIAFSCPQGRIDARRGGAGIAEPAGNPENEIHDIKVDGDFVWVATSGGVIEYDGRTGVFRRKLKKVDGLAHDFVGSVYVDARGSKWFGTYGGISSFDGANWRTYDHASTGGILSDSVVNAILQDRNGLYWIGTAKGGVFTFDGSRWASHGVAQGLPNNEVHCIVEDPDGSIWVCTEGGIGRYTGGSWTKYTAKEGVVSDRVLTCVIDRSGNRWFGTWGAGLARYDGKSWTATPGGEPNGPLSGFIFRSKMDDNGDLWFGTYSGVSVWNGVSWKHFRPEDGLLGNDVYALDVDRHGFKWFGTYKGLSSLDPSNANWKRYPR